MPGGRPTIYNDELVAEISRRLAEGESLRSICRDADMPALSSVLLWVVDGKHPEFSAQYRIAREAQGHSDGDKIREIAERVAREELSPQAAKVIIDAYRWTAERNASKHFQPQQKIDHTSSDESMKPVGKVQIQVIDGSENKGD